MPSGAQWSADIIWMDLIWLFLWKWQLSQHEAFMPLHSSKSPWGIYATSGILQYGCRSSNWHLWCLQEATTSDLCGKKTLVGQGTQVLVDSRVLWWTKKIKYVKNICIKATRSISWRKKHLHWNIFQLAFDWKCNLLGNNQEISFAQSYSELALF